MMPNTEKKIKPFIKWAGGKGQLINEIEKFYPFNDEINKYAEPFVGAGAVLFNILKNFNLKDIYISDINPELINTYQIIKNKLNLLIEILLEYQSIYHSLNTIDQKIFYTRKRELFNKLIIEKNKNKNIEKAALFIFLNKTCFNGLYRVNKKGIFNVPIGSYKNPLICDINNLKSICRLLQNVTIVCNDYRKSSSFIDKHTFVYLDPPYRPLTNTSNFTAYTDSCFDDHAQIELAKFVDKMHKKGAKILISNSDPQNSIKDDTFFDRLYSQYKIFRLHANRMINCKSTGRGTINELLISTFN